MTESNKKTNLLSNFLDKIRANKKIQYLIIGVFLVIIIFVFLFGNIENSSQTLEKNDEIINYVNGLENKLSGALSEVSGAGKVSVVITIESGMETVLAMQSTTKKNADGQIEVQTTPVMVNGKTVELKQLYPKIKGVLIVAEGANSIGVMTKIQQATMSLFDIEINQIEILTMK